MKFPGINNAGNNTLFTNSFGGINKTAGSPFGEWEELTGFDITNYPVLSTVAAQGNKTAVEHGKGTVTGTLMYEGQLIYTVASGIYIGGEKIPLQLSSGNKQLVAMGNYIVIIPDLIKVSVTDKTAQTSVIKSADVTGTLFEINTTDSKGKKYKNLFLRILPEENYEFKDGQEVVLKIGGKELHTVIRSVTTPQASDNSDSDIRFVNFDVTSMPDTEYFYINDTEGSEGGTAMAENVIMHSPLKYKVFKHVTEHNNRLWACSEDGHEIYCSRLGDPLIWGEYMGLSTDCYSVTVGSEGKFTGSAIFCGKVMFFKENCVHCIYGTAPSNFTLTHYKISGVKSGCERSICAANGLIYYQGRNGIYAFNGSSAYRIDQRLGFHSACYVGAADEDVLCMVAMGSLPTAAGNGLTMGSMCYIYDFAHDAWHKEFKDRSVTDAFSYNGIKLLLAPNTDAENYVMHNITPDAGDLSVSINTYPSVAVTGNLLQNIPFMKHAVKIKLLTDNYLAGSLKIELAYNGDGAWKKVYEKNAVNTGGIITIPITDNRFFRIKMRITATGEFRLYGIYLITEQGSELI